MWYQLRTLLLININILLLQIPPSLWRPHNGILSFRDKFRQDKVMLPGFCAKLIILQCLLDYWLLSWGWVRRLSVFSWLKMSQTRNLSSARNCLHWTRVSMVVKMTFPQKKLNLKSRKHNCNMLDIISLFCFQT